MNSNLQMIFPELFGLAEYLQACFNFLMSLDWRQWGIIFWYFACLEFPRYILTDFVVLTRHFSGSQQNFQREEFLHKLIYAPPLVSVIVPAYNEDRTIHAVLSSLLRQTYPRIELIVVDDGSIDNTKEICRPLAEAGKIKYLRNELRGGKSSAANMGFYHSRGEFIITIDADTVFNEDAITKILTGFADPRVGAVSGNIRISNAKENLLTRVQAIHYLLTISMGRMASAGMDMLLIVSGAFGAYRRDLLESTGGWDAGPGEDVDVTLKGRMKGVKIAFVPDAVCWTKVPSTFPAFIRQQLRWESSLIFYCLRKYNLLMSLFSYNFRLGDFLAAMDVFIFQITMTYSFFFYLGWLFIYYQDLFVIILLSSFLFYLIANTGQLFISWLFSNYKKQDISLFVYIPLYCLFISYFLRVIRAWAYTEEVCFRRSFRDKHVPKKVLEEMIRW